MPLDQSERYLTVEQTAERYNVSTDSIYRWKREGDFPKPVHLSKGVTRWRLSDLLAYEATLQASFTTHLQAPVSDRQNLV